MCFGCVRDVAKDPNALGHTIAYCGACNEPQNNRNRLLSSKSAKNEGETQKKQPKLEVHEHTTHIHTIIIASAFVFGSSSQIGKHSARHTHQMILRILLAVFRSAYAFVRFCILSVLSVLVATRAFIFSSAFFLFCCIRLSAVAYFIRAMVVVLGAQCIC